MTRIITVMMVLLFAAGVLAGRAASAPAQRRGEAGEKAMGRSPTRAGGGEGDRRKNEIPSTGPVMTGPRMHGAAVYPKQEVPLHFNHGQHLGLGIACVDCHSSIDDSRRSSDNNFPRGVSCDSCHGKQHPKPRDEPAKCGLCHTKVDGSDRVTAGLRSPKPMLHFNHQLHAKVGAACEDCHGNMTKVRLATTAQLPKEKDCLTCHDGIGATDRCGACHPTEASGRLQIRAMDRRAIPALVPQGGASWGITHDLSFVEDHAHEAKANGKLCESCHDETMCTDCHAGAIRPLRIHSGDFITTHALDANARSNDCQACHRTQTFCLGCHQRLGLDSDPGSEFSVGGPLRFHPNDWSGPPGLPQGHAHAAQRNIAACASCHTEDSCLACHATTSAATPGLGVTPHGPGFRDSAKCNALATRNRRVCLKCHAPGTPALDCM